MNISIIGAGGWGTALSVVLSNNKHSVKIWSYEQSTCDEINNFHQNNKFLPGIIIPNDVIALSNINDCEDSDFIVLTVPTKFIRTVFHHIDFQINKKNIIVGTKGIENISLLRISELLYDIISLPHEQHVVLTGPSHAEEVSRNCPTTVVAASANIDLAKQVQQIFSNSYFRVYTSNDVVGCEIAGSLKNVIAIAAGIIDGLNLGDNTKAALITRGLAEISRLAIAMGANPNTISGLSGLGDLFVTCNSKHSRNRFVGEEIGKGKSINNITNDMNMIAEGIYTTESAFALGKKYNVELPITEQMYEIIFDNKKPVIAMNELMNRSSKHEC